MFSKIVAVITSGFVNNRKLRESIKLENERIALFNQRVALRFPNAFVMPHHILDRLLQQKDYDGNSTYHRESEKDWLALLEEYPVPPENDDDRQRREVNFWLKYARKFSTKDSRGHLILQAKHIITDYFINHEKWILREFYAASGTVIDPALKQHSKLVDDFMYKESWRLDRHHDFLTIREFFSSGIQEHFKKWGDWFFFNINDHFEQHLKFSPPPTPEPVKSQPESYDDDELSYKRNL